MLHFAKVSQLRPSKLFLLYPFGAPIFQHSPLKLVWHHVFATLSFFNSPAAHFFCSFAYLLLRPSVPPSFTLLSATIYIRFNQLKPSPIFHLFFRCILLPFFYFSPHRPPSLHVSFSPIFHHPIPFSLHVSLSISLQHKIFTLYNRRDTILLLRKAIV